MGPLRIIKSSKEFLLFKALILVVLFFIISSNPATASAGYYLTKKGELISIKSCINAKSKSPLLLQIEVNRSHWKTVSVIKFSNLKQDRCLSNQLTLIYQWKVNVTNGGALRVLDSKQKKEYFVTPDGIRLS
jgi:hypothetical protein